MMRKRNFSGPQNFGSSKSSVSGAMNWASNNRIMVLVAVIAVAALGVALAAYFNESFRNTLKDTFANLTGKKGGSSFKRA